MDKNDIIALPNTHLRDRSKKVGIITPEIKKVIANMQAATLDWEASRKHEVGVALAAIQVDIPLKIVIVRNNFDDKSDHSFTTFINPIITKREGDVIEDFEGCLSVPDVYGKVPRFSRIKIKALDINGSEFRVTAEDFLARVLQHEIDHTNGIVFIDHIKDNKQSFYKLEDNGELQQLNYDKVIRTNPILWK